MENISTRWRYIKALSACYDSETWLHGNHTGVSKIKEEKKNYLTWLYISLFFSVASYSFVLLYNIALPSLKKIDFYEMERIESSNLIDNLF